VACFSSESVCGKVQGIEDGQFCWRKVTEMKTRGDTPLRKDCLYCPWKRTRNHTFLRILGKTRGLRSSNLKSSGETDGKKDLEGERIINGTIRIHLRFKSEKDEKRKRVLVA